MSIEKLILCGITATPPHKEILKTALGAENTVRWEHAEVSLDAARAESVRDVRRDQIGVFRTAHGRESVIGSSRG